MEHVRHCQPARAGFPSGSHVDLMKVRLWYSGGTVWLETVTPYAEGFVESRTWPMGDTVERLGVLDEVVAQSGDDLYRLVTMYLGIQEQLAGMAPEPASDLREGLTPT